MSTSVSKRLRHLRPFAMLLAIVACVFVLDRVTALSLSKALTYSRHRIAAIYGPRLSADLLVLGNSVADAMTTAPLLASATGMSVYTVAVHGLDARLQHIFVEDYLERHRAPKVAIMEIRPTSDRELVADAYAMYAKHSPEILDLAESNDDFLIPWRRVFASYNFNSREFPGMITRIFFGNPQAESFSNGVINESQKQSFVRGRKLLRVGDEALRDFIRTIGILQARGVKVVVVAAPTHSVRKELGDWSKVYADTVMKALPRETVFYDAQDLYQGDESFDDPTHLNERGRQQFTPVLAQLIQDAVRAQ